jgi:hypothetical protein
MGFEEYTDLVDTGFQGGSGAEQVPPEEEFFHSVYVSGSDRKNHINITENAGKLQIRGVQYNLDEVHLVITHTKEILCNVKNEKGKESIVCFSFKEGAPPWFGTTTLPDGSKRQCPQTSAERAINDFCSPCRAQILVAGIYCKPDGSPILTEDKKPIFVFMRGKGMRYSNISTYLSERFNEDLPPIFEPVTEQSKEFEKRVVNNKRFVIKVTRGQEQSSYGSMVNVFVLEKGSELPKESVFTILKLSKQTVGKFNEKFDWSKGKQAVGYGSNQAPEGVMRIEDEQKSGESKSKDEGSSEQSSSGGEQGKVFSFDDINF